MSQNNLFNSNETHEQWLERRVSELLLERERLFREVERLEKLTGGLSNLSMHLLAAMAEAGIPHERVQQIFKKEHEERCDEDEKIAAYWKAAADQFECATKVLNRVAVGVERLAAELKL